MGPPRRALPLLEWQKFLRAGVSPEPAQEDFDAFAEEPDAPLDAEGLDSPDGLETVLRLGDRVRRHPRGHEGQEGDCLHPLDLAEAGSVPLLRTIEVQEH